MKFPLKINGFVSVPSIASRLRQVLILGRMKALNCYNFKEFIKRDDDFVALCCNSHVIKFFSHKLPDEHFRFIREVENASDILQSSLFAQCWCEKQSTSTRYHHSCAWIFFQDSPQDTVCMLNYIECIWLRWTFRVILKQI